MTVQRHTWMCWICRVWHACKRIQPVVPDVRCQTNSRRLSRTKHASIGLTYPTRSFTNENSETLANIASKWHWSHRPRAIEHVSTHFGRVLARDGALRKICITSFTYRDTLQLILIANASFFKVHHSYMYMTETGSEICEQGITDMEQLVTELLERCILRWELFGVNSWIQSICSLHGFTLVEIERRNPVKRVTMLSYDRFVYTTPLLLIRLLYFSCLWEHIPNVSLLLDRHNDRFGIMFHIGVRDTLRA